MEPGYSEHSNTSTSRTEPINMPYQYPYPFVPNNLFFINAVDVGNQKEATWVAHAVFSPVDALWVVINFPRMPPNHNKHPI